MAWPRQLRDLPRCLLRASLPKSGFCHVRCHCRGGLGAAGELGWSEVGHASWRAVRIVGAPRPQMGQRLPRVAKGSQSKSVDTGKERAPAASEPLRRLQLYRALCF